MPLQYLYIVMCTSGSKYEQGIVLFQGQQSLAKSVYADILKLGYA